MYQKIVSNNNIVEVSRKKVILAISLLSLLSALMLSLPFLAEGLWFVALVALVPLFAAEEIASRRGLRRFWIIYYSAFLIWNLLTTWWVYLATPPGAIAAFTLNALQMSIIFSLFRRMKRLSGGFLPYLFFIIAWLAWEHCYFNWQVSWPWLVLGNAFATSLPLIQWYEYTGTLGGSLWVLLVNTLLFRLLLLKARGERSTISAISLALLILLPIILSLSIWYRMEKSPNDGKGESRAQFAIIQPNIDPYIDKFGGMDQSSQTTKLLELSARAVEESRGGEPGRGEKSLVVLSPETFLSPDGSRNSFLFENDPLANPSFRRIYDFAQRTGTDYIVGGVTYSYNSSSSRPYTHNTAAMVYRNGSVEYYHKSKLVIMAESTPFTGILKPLERFAIDLGGSVGSFTTQKERSIFRTESGVKLGTAICYESVYGDFYREYILKGANVMSIITNDGWWGDTPGHRQHLHYASLRAIETRRAIARCANTGISAFIEPSGKIVAASDWWKPQYLTGSLPLEERLTFFVTNGDVIGRVALFLFWLLLAMGIVRRLTIGKLSQQGTK